MPGDRNSHTIPLRRRLDRMQAATKLRWGILGTGNIARQFAAGVRSAQRSTLQAVGSRTPGSATGFALVQGVTTAHGSYQSLLADRSVDAIYNALPNSMHHDWTIAALRAGKHVLCEKPFATSVADAQEMFSVAQREGRMLAEAFMYRSHPQTLAIQQAVADGAIGELRLIRTSFCYKTTRIADNIRFSADMGGGALMDVGCYCLSFSRLFAGADPIHLTAAARLHASGVDEMAVGTLAYPNGILASFTCGMTAAADNTAYLCGTNGFIEIPVPWKPPVGRASYTLRQGIPPRMQLDGKPPAAPSPVTVNVPSDRDLYACEADDFAAAVLDGLPLRVTQEETLSIARQLDEMRRQINIR